MQARLTGVVMLLAMASSATAQTANRDTDKAPEAQQRRAAVTLASQDAPHPAATNTLQPSSGQAKRPRPRVTTCRCGDQELQSPSDDATD